MYVNTIVISNQNQCMVVRSEKKSHKNLVMSLNNNNNNNIPWKKTWWDNTCQKLQCY